MAHAKWRDVIKQIRNREEAEGLLSKHGRDKARHTRGMVPGSPAHVEVKAALNWLNMFSLGVVVEVTTKKKTARKRKG